MLTVERPPRDNKNPEAFRFSGASGFKSMQDTTPRSINDLFSSAYGAFSPGASCACAF
jgi:hypothetical protein